MAEIRFNKPGEMKPRTSHSSVLESAQGWANEATLGQKGKWGQRKWLILLAELYPLESYLLG